MFIGRNFNKLICKCRNIHNIKRNFSVKNVTIVDSVDKAKEIVEKLQTMTNEIHACDTETTNFDMTKGPLGIISFKCIYCIVGGGKIICFSIYCGPQHNFGSGSRLWIDNLSNDLIPIFKPYLENPNIPKIWHNYSFDRHMFWNHEVNVLGLKGDTMHMTRLMDSSRLKNGGYSLESVSNDFYIRKRPMKEIFSVAKLKRDGTPGKATYLPPTVELQTDEKYKDQWIEYSAFDAEATWHVYQEIKQRLMNMEWSKEIDDDGNVKKLTMFDFYERYFIHFGELLTDMERNGVKLNTKYLGLMEIEARKDLKKLDEIFRDWIKKYTGDETKYLNLSSASQKQHLLYAPYCNKFDESDIVPKERIFKIENTEGIIEPGKKKALKNRNMKLVGLGIPPTEYSKSGWPSVTSESLSHLAGNIKNEKYGPVYTHFGGGEEGKRACIAIDALSKYGSIETMIGSFLQPLQSMVDKNSRVHGSFNLNTETGRLSSRNPNLQNQPALDKDKYFVRKAFTCDDDHILIVSDYSQLELRVLAHMTNCKSMLDAFLLGGDFHSRTAYGMYDKIKEAVAHGKVRLETGPDTDPNIPTIKDVFASERKKAKVLNFSIAYGKTARGLAKDFGVSVQEAQETLNKWYKDRPEVKEWQEITIQYAHQTGYTRTLMGRYRRLPHINSKSAGVRSHMERAAINTPIQGGAADIVMMAMLKVHHDERIREKGYKMVIQVHDEIMMDGPEEYKDEVLKMVKEDMEHPFKKDLKVALTADANYAKTWYEAK